MSTPAERLEQLKLRFLERTRGDLDIIRTERDPERLRAVVHRLSGAAGTFGYTSLSVAAGEVDDQLMTKRTPPMT